MVHHLLATKAQIERQRIMGAQSIADNLVYMSLVVA
jgi:hypothetical protein